uniref:Uncharacterized protein n=1 Tax=Tanacetum cinerariifolium TaxID=118510 RepID=A0A699HQT7_TANCI|nr:hypothetical protein [Tanacetum cinerariifolium]
MAQSSQQLLIANDLVPKEYRYEVAKVNKKVDLLTLTCPPATKIIKEIILQHPLQYALTASASVPLIYMQQMWHTLQLDGFKEAFKFFIDRHEVKFNVNDLRTVLQLPLATINGNAKFVKALEFLTITEFLSILGHVVQEIPYTRFSNLIIEHILATRPVIPRRSNEPHHLVPHDDVVKYVFASGNKSRGMGIPDELLTKEIKQTDAFKTYTTEFAIDVPIIQPQPIESS